LVVQSLPNQPSGLLAALLERRIRLLEPYDSPSRAWSDHPSNPQKIAHLADVPQNPLVKHNIHRKDMPDVTPVSGKKLFEWLLLW
jgi:hypothetical protein